MDAIDPVLLTLLPQDIKNLFFPYASVQLWALLLNLLLGFLLASIIGLHFRHYSSAFCNRQDFSRLFPLLMLTVILIITVVKASLTASSKHYQRRAANITNEKPRYYVKNNVQFRPIASNNVLFIL